MALLKVLLELETIFTWSRIVKLRVDNNSLLNCSELECLDCKTKNDRIIRLGCALISCRIRFLNIVDLLYVVNCDNLNAVVAANHVIST